MGSGAHYLHYITLHYAPSNGSWWGVWTRGSMFEKRGVIFYNSITSQRMYNKRKEPGYQVYLLRLLSFLIICFFFSNKIADKQLTFTSFKHTMNWQISRGASCCAWPKNTVSKLLCAVVEGAFYLQLRRALRDG